MVPRYESHGIEFLVSGDRPFLGGWELRLGNGAVGYDCSGFGVEDNVSGGRVNAKDVQSDG